MHIKNANALKCTIEKTSLQYLRVFKQESAGIQVAFVVLFVATVVPLMIVHK